MGYSRFHTVALNRAVCEWLAPICFSLIFILSFFNWAGLYPAGYGAYTQNCWQALGALMSVDPVSEIEFRMEGPLNERLWSSWWLLPYIIFLIVGLTLAWADPIMKLMKGKLPTALEGVWRYRPALISACAGLTLFLVLIQSVAGFGIEWAIKYKVLEDFKQLRSDAKTPEQIQIAEMKIAGEKNRYQPGTTSWLRLVILLHFLAVAGIIGETVLLHRGAKPPPRVGVMW
ncbi:MAG: hypothetical protein K8T89_05685 [Planctomycetes bacterium]|nr:hypothetical protein [Planctomycetota bacterium]